MYTTRRVKFLHRSQELGNLLTTSTTGGGGGGCT